MAVAARARLQELLDVEAAPPAVADRLVSALDARVSRTQLRLDPPPPPDGSPTGATAAARPSTGRLYRELRRELLAAETAELVRLRDTGVISEDVRRRVQRAVDLEDAALADGLT